MLSANFVAWFKDTLQENDMLHMYNDLYERIFKRFPTTHTADDTELLRKTLETNCVDKKFNDMIVDIFDNYFESAYEFKNAVRLTDDDKFSTMAIDSAVRILRDVADSVKSVPIKNFVKLITFAPADYLKKASESYDTLGFKAAYDAFGDYVNEFMDKYVETENLHEPTRLIGFVCQNDKAK